MLIAYRILTLLITALPPGFVPMIRHGVHRIHARQTDYQTVDPTFPSIAQSQTINAIGN
jgi:hypothetical protein